MRDYAKRPAWQTAHDLDDKSSCNPRRRAHFIVIAPFVVALFAPATVLARGGGLRWGYVNEVQGNPFINLWLMTNPWSQMSGWAIPHHNLGPNGLPPQGGPDGGGQTSPYGNTWRTQPFDRSVFTGSASQPSSYVAPARPSFASTTMTAPVPTGPYRIDRSLDPPYFRNYNRYWRHGYWGGGLRGWADRRTGAAW